MLLEPRFKMAVNNNVNDKEGTSYIPVDHAYVNLQPTSSKRLQYNDELALDLDAYVDHPPEIPEGDEVEIWQYINDNFSGKEDFYSKDQVESFDILKFWNSQKQTFPNLSRLACCILAIPCSSAASEHLFSCAGRVYEER